MGRVLEIIEELQSLYRKFNMEKFEAEFIANKEINDTDEEVISSMMELAKELRDKYSVSIFDFSSNYNFLKSMQEFCKVR